MSKIKNKLTKASSLIQRLAFREIMQGQSVYCGLCSWRGVRFMRAGRCPSCQSLPRHRLIPFSLQYFGTYFDHSTILHLGSNIDEFIFISTKFSPKKYLTMDRNAYRFINFIGDAKDINLADSSVDIILAWHVLEHIPEDRQVISEFFRVLTPGGACIVSVPIWPANNPTTFEAKDVAPNDFLRVFGHPDHVRGCGLDYCFRFEEAGFAKQELFVRDIARHQIEFFGLRSDHVAWQFTKPKQSNL